MSLSDPRIVEREYATVDRVSMRRLDRTAWLRGGIEPIETLLRAIAELRPRRILDAGCGDDRFTSLITAHDVVGVDRSEAAVKAASRRGLAASVADIESLPFSDGEFDIVMSNWVLYHLPNVDRGIAELARVLRPGGRFVGAYNLDDHLAELWAAVGYQPPRASFDGWNGTELLARHFAHVERRDTGGTALWETTEALQAYLDAYSEMNTQKLQAPDGPYPFRASRRNCVFVADRGSR